MSDSPYYISIRRHDGQEVKLRPGGQGERELCDAFAKQLPYMTTRAAAVRVLKDLIHALKREVLS